MKKSIRTDQETSYIYTQPEKNVVTSIILYLFCLLLHLAKFKSLVCLYSLNTVSIRCTHAVCSNTSFSLLSNISFYDYTTIYACLLFKDIWLFALFDYCKQCHYKHACTCSSVNICLLTFVGQVHQHGMAKSQGIHFSRYWQAVFQNGFFSPVVPHSGTLFHKVSVAPHSG